MRDYFGIWIFCSLNFSDQEHSKYEVKGGKQEKEVNCGFEGVPLGGFLRTFDMLFTKKF